MINKHYTRVRSKTRLSVGLRVCYYKVNDCLIEG